MNNVYAVRIENNYEGMAVFVVSAGSRDECLSVVEASEEYDWLSSEHDLSAVKEEDATNYGITSQPSGVLDTYEFFID